MLHEIAKDIIKNYPYSKGKITVLNGLVSDYLTVEFKGNLPISNLYSIELFLKNNYQQLEVQSTCSKFLDGKGKVTAKIKHDLIKKPMGTTKY